MKKFMTLIISGLMLTGCLGAGTKFSNAPTPILCKQAASLSPVYMHYGALMAELNKRGANCAEFIGDSTTIKIL